MSFRSRWWWLLRAALLVAAFIAALGHASGYGPLRFVTELDLALADARLRALMPRTLDARIVIVDVDEKSLAAVGRWPWPRERLAALTTELFERQRAAVVGFDMLFAEPDLLGGDAPFARALQGQRAVLGYYLTSDRQAHQAGELPPPVFDAAALQGRSAAVTRWDGYAANLAVLAQSAPLAGYFNSVPDADGQVRSVPLIAAHAGRYYEPLALAMLRSFTGLPTVRPGFSDQRWIPGEYRALASIQLQQGAQVMALPVDESARALIPFRGPGGPNGGSFEYVSAGDLLAGRVPAAHLEGKLVLVGTTAPGLYDQRPTPVAAVYPGVEVHANLLSGLLDGRLPNQPDWARGFDSLQLLCTALLLGVVLPRVRAWRALQLVCVWVAVLVAVNLWGARAYGLQLPLAAVLLFTGVGYAGITVWGYIVEGRRRRALARLFGAYVPPELVTEMARDPARYDMRAENRELTVMFCDMRNFTRVSEQLAPEDVRALVNRFFSSMTQAIGEQRGTLDKYIGDALMAFWGAPLADPTHAAHAVRAAMAMVQRLQPLNAELRERQLPEIGVGIGLNTGVVCVGDMGSNIRRSYTVMGDAVNLASRIEALTRHYGVDILVGEPTRVAADAAPDAAPGAAFVWVEVDRVRVKGKQQSVTLFTPAPAALLATPTFDLEMRLWRLVLDAYRLQHWVQAQLQLQELQTQFPASPLAGLYEQLGVRIQFYCCHPPPEDWDGTQTFDSK